MYEKLIAELRQHHCDAREDDTQEVCEECAYDVIIADKSVPSGIASVCVCGLMHRAADVIEELQKTVYFHKYNSEFWEDKYNSLADEKWIPVTERLPDESEPVLACVYWPDYTDNEICYGQYIKNGRFRLTHYVEGELIKGYEVKAWMPLPEPPKEET